MKYVLDTHVVSALMKGDAHVIERLQRVPKSQVLVPQPVLAEIAYGIARLPASKRRDRLRERFDLVSSELLRSVWSDAVSERFGAVKALLEQQGRRIEDFDAAIAAHALAEEATVVTANVTDMVRVPEVAIADWSAGESEPS